MANITRIKNNQVTDNTIEFQKIKDGTLVGTKFNANLTLNSNVTILGNLTVANSFAQLNSINTYINDPVVVFNNNYTGSPSYDIGILVNRNLSSLPPYGSVNAAFVWKESETAFEGLMTTETGTTAGLINNSGFANLIIGNITANTTTIRDVTDTTSTTTGVLQVRGGVGISKNLFVGSNVATTGAGLTTSNTTAYVFNESVTTLYVGRSATTTSISADTGTTTINNNLVTTGITRFSSNIVAASGTNSTTNNTGALVVVGGVGIANDVNIGGYVDVDGIATVHGNLIADSGTPSISPTTGALVVSGIGGAGIGGQLNVAGVTTVSNVTESSSSTTAALVVTGGVGIGKSLIVGGNAFVAGNLTVQGDLTYINTSTLTVEDSILELNTSSNGAALTTNVLNDVGIRAHYFDVADKAAFFGRTKASGFFEYYGTATETTGNISGTLSTIRSGEYTAANTTASTDRTTGALRVAGGVGIQGDINGGNAIFKAINNTPIGNTTPSTGAFTTITSTLTTISTGNIVAASGTPSTSISTGSMVVAGGLGVSGAVNIGETARVFGNLLAISGTNSVSPQTGALVVVGGAGISSNVFVGGSTTLNSTKTSGYDTLVKGVNDETLIWARPNALYDQVVIGNSAVVANLVAGAKLIINSTDSMIIPTGTSAQRPSSSGGADVVGMLRYNVTTNAPEYYDGEAWTGFATNITVITDEQFSGDGVTINFTLEEVTTTASTIVSINGVLQIPTLAYSCTDNILTFTEAPQVGDLIDVRRLVTTVAVASLASVNGYMQVEVLNEGINFSTGTSGATVTTYWDPSGAKVSFMPNVSVTTANTATTVDSFLANTFRSAKYTVQITSGTNYQVSEALVIHNGTTATLVEYGVVSTNGNLGVLNATISGENTVLQVVASAPNSIVRITKDYTRI